MRPEEMRAALVAKLEVSMCGFCTERKSSRCANLPSHGCINHWNAEKTAETLDAFLSEIGAKITVREPSEAQRRINGSANWPAMWDAAKTVPWEEDRG